MIKKKKSSQKKRRPSVKNSPHKKKAKKQSKKSFKKQQTGFRDSFFKASSKRDSVLKDSPSHDKENILTEYELPFDFSQEVLKQADSLPSKLSPSDYENRKDLREKPFITIDGETARDFDDAILIEKFTDKKQEDIKQTRGTKQKEAYKLYVAIADVSYYVKEGSPIDKEAFERANSTYFPDFCIPMLPEKLSNNLCSLKEKEDRLVMVQEMDFDSKGRLLQSKLYPSVIKSQKRFTYKEVEKLLELLQKKDSSFLACERKAPYWDSLKHAKTLTEILIQKHKREEGFDLDIPETLVILDKEGLTKKLMRETRLFSHKMIEHFMLACNQAVSLYLNQKKQSFIYRIHETPKKTKLQALEMFAKSLSFSKPIQSRQEILSFLNHHKNHERTPLIHKLFLRSMSQARYSAFNKGHYGLNFKLYTHFTSPIRRYSDLIVHRLAKKTLQEETQSLKPKRRKLLENELEEQAVWLSSREQKSVKAERRMKDIKTARFLKAHVGETCEGFVSSLVSFGMFISLEDFFVEGLVRFQEMKGFWESDDWGLKAEHKKTKYKIQFGDPVEVLIQAVSVEAGQIDLKLQSHKGKNFFKAH